MVDSTAAYERNFETSSLSLINGDRASAERAPRSTIHGSQDLERSGAEHVSALIKMGALKQEAGDYPEAEDLFRRALELITESGLGEDDPDFAILVNDLARLCLKQSAHAVAEPLLLRLLAMKRSKGDDHPEVATVLASLAAVRQALGRHESAEQLWRRVLDIRERTLAPNHLGLATALERLADSCSARGKIGEAVQLSQRALTIRELTLGAGNPSLRVSRDRIADLQLQASEEALDASALQSAPPTDERYRLLSGDHSLQSVSRPVQERSAATVEVEKAATEPRKAKAVVPRIELARAKEEIELPVPLSLEQDIADNLAPHSQLAVDKVIPEDFEPSPLELVDYHDVILSIRQELEDDDNASTKPTDRLKQVLGSIGEALRQRQKEIAVTVGAVALVAGLTTVSQALIQSQQAGRAQEATALPGADQTTAAPVTETVGRPSSPDDRAKAPAVASAAAIPVAPPSRARVVEQRTPANRARDSREPRPISIPSLSSTVMAGFDSVVRARTPGARSVGEPIDLAPPPVSIAATPNVSFALESQVAPPQRARLIGRLPVPRYPAQMANARGDVTVQFEVDASGRPVVSTLAVLASSNESFTTEVFKMIPSLRFEPALSGGSNPKPITDVVQLEIAFRPTK